MAKHKVFTDTTQGHRVQKEIGHVRPYRTEIKHTVCGTVFTLIPEDAEAHARFPGFYHHIWCPECSPEMCEASEFVWDDGSPVETPDQVGERS
jgi:hypothetical protein